MKPGNMFFLVIAVLLVLAVVECCSLAKKNSVGQACESNSTCIGQNEFCQEITWLSPSCSTKGICQCLPCFTTGNFHGDSWDAISKLPCAPIVKLDFGDACQGVYNEQYPSSHSDCIHGKVLCLPGHNCMIGNNSSKSTKEGTACSKMDDCAGEMVCNRNRCCCSNIYEHFDIKTGKCFRRDLGDPCSTDDECKVSGRHWEGFTWDSAICRDGLCSCGPNTQTNASYLDPESGQVKTKTICVNPKGSTQLVRNSQCTPDPVYYSDLPFVAVCASDFVCVSCPEEHNWMIGKCRSVVGQKKPLCISSQNSSQQPIATTTPINFLQFELSTTTEMARNSTTTNEEVTVSPPYEEVINHSSISVAMETTTATTKYENVTLEQLATTTIVPYCITYCQNDSNCKRNEECALSFCTFPRQCRCKNGFRRDTVTHQCVAISYKRLGDYCNPDDPMPPHAICQNSTVICNDYFTQHGNFCSNRVRQGSFGAKCGVQQPCHGNQLWCADHFKTCRCYESFAMKWNNEFDRCERREYGDPCNNDAECAVFGSISKGGYTYGGGICAKTWGALVGRCDCASNFFPYRFTYFDSNAGKLLSKTICIHQSSVTNVPPGQRCTVDPIEYADNPLGQTRVCRHGNVCVRCPNDPVARNLPQLQGLCT